MLHFLKEITQLIQAALYCVNLLSEYPQTSEKLHVLLWQHYYQLFIPQLLMKLFLFKSPQF